MHPLSPFPKNHMYTIAISFNSKYSLVLSDVCVQYFLSSIHKKHYEITNITKINTIKYVVKIKELCVCPLKKNVVFFFFFDCDFFFSFFYGTKFLSVGYSNKLIFIGFSLNRNYFSPDGFGELKIYLATLFDRR